MQTISVCSHRQSDVRGPTFKFLLSVPGIEHPIFSQKLARVMKGPQLNALTPTQDDMALIIEQPGSWRLEYRASRTKASSSSRRGVAASGPCTSIRLGYPFGECIFYTTSPGRCQREAEHDVCPAQCVDLGLGRVVRAAAAGYHYLHDGHSTPWAAIHSPPTWSSRTTASAPH